jgi:N-acetylglucosaminyl-diphospho-decaprenol L-rhamnosyltransferase
LKLQPPYDVSIIIVNYNTADFLPKCLESISAQSNVNHEVIVVDNASEDNSLGILKNRFPWVRLIANKDNLGFARASNQALKYCTGKYVYFLNPDTEVRKRALKNMIGFMEAHPQIGLAGTRLINPDGSPQPSVEKRYPGQRHAKHELKGLKGDIAFVLGASMIAKRTIVNDLEGFDERFFLYGEDQDICLSIRKAGWTIGYIPDAIVVHWGGQSERDNLPEEVWKKKFEAEFIFYNKHYSPRTIRAIKRANLIQAYWRVFTLKLSLPFCSEKGISLKKLDKYRLVLEMFQTRRP